MSRVLPILFNTEMVKAILDGRKNTTRRVIKFPQNRFTGEIPKADHVKAYENTLFSDKISFHEDPHYCFDVKTSYQLGDILYVRETWSEVKFASGGHRKYLYRASDSNLKPSAIGCVVTKYPWHPSIHMPKKAARIWLKVTGVRVERLQDINGQEVLKEGINSYVRPREKFEELWNSTIKKADWNLYGWDANPWVWVIKFERCERPREGKC